MIKMECKHLEIILLFLIISNQLVKKSFLCVLYIQYIFSPFFGLSTHLMIYLFPPFPTTFPFSYIVMESVCSEQGGSVSIPSDYERSWLRWLTLTYDYTSEGMLTIDMLLCVTAWTQLEK